MKIALLLTPRQARRLLTLLRREARRARRAYEKSNFVPEPGHEHSDLDRAKMYSEIGETLKLQLDAVQQEHSK